MPICKLDLKLSDWKVRLLWTADAFFKYVKAFLIYREPTPARLLSWQPGNSGKAIGTTTGLYLRVSECSERASPWHTVVSLTLYLFVKASFVPMTTLVQPSLTYCAFEEQKPGVSINYWKSGEVPGCKFRDDLETGFFRGKGGVHFSGAEIGKFVSRGFGCCNLCR